MRPLHSVTFLHLSMLTLQQSHSPKRAATTFNSLSFNHLTQLTFLTPRSLFGTIRYDKVRRHSFSRLPRSASGPWPVRLGPRGTPPNTRRHGAAEARFSSAGTRLPQLNQVTILLIATVLSVCLTAAITASASPNRKRETRNTKPGTSLASSTPVQPCRAILWTPATPARRCIERWLNAICSGHWRE